MNYTQRITIETPTRNTVNTFGSIQTSAWTEFMKTGAKIRQMSSSEVVTGSRETDVLGHMFEIRMTTKSMQIDDRQRIITADGTIFEIMNVDKFTLKGQRIILIKTLRRS